MDTMRTFNCYVSTVQTIALCTVIGTVVTSGLPLFDLGILILHVSKCVLQEVNF